MYETLNQEEKKVEWCPICGSFLKMENKVVEMRRSPNFFSGLGLCFNCGRMRLSGRVDGEVQKVMAITPVCSCCESDVPVVRLNPFDAEDPRWCCQACGSLIEIHNKTIVRIPSPMQLRPALAVV